MYLNFSFLSLYRAWSTLSVFPFTLDLEDSEGTPRTFILYIHEDLPIFAPLLEFKTKLIARMLFVWCRK